MKIGAWSWLLPIFYLLSYSETQASSSNNPSLKKLMITQSSPSRVEGEDFFYRELSPKFYLVQFGLEKLDFLLHKEFSNLLYTRYKKKDVFGLFGFNNLQQGHIGDNYGYNIKDYYQFLGAEGDVGSFSILGALGVSESKLHIHQNQSNADYNTLWGTLGFVKKTGNFQFGCDLISGYGFISSTTTSSFSSKIKSHNHASFGSFETKGTYRILNDKTSVEPYDALSLFYSSESPYQQKGSNELTLKIKNENLVVIRNELGFYLNIPCTKAVDLFIDPSWTYEYQINHGSYTVCLTGEKQDKLIEFNHAPRNYGRLNVGFFIKGSDVDFAVTYIGLWADKFSSASTSLKLDVKF